MKKIVLAAANQKFLSSLENILSTIGIKQDFVCRSASEVMTLSAEFEDALLICGPLKDAPAIYVAKELPNGWDVILLLASDQPFPYYVSNIIPVTLPVNRKELAETVYSVIGSSGETYGSKTTAKKVRPDEEKQLIEKAKRNIMNKRKLSESDAHKLLLRYSMNLGITLVQTAERFIEE